MTEEATVRRWRKFGKDRLYVTTSDGTAIGWHDLVAAQLVKLVKRDPRWRFLHAVLVGTKARRVNPDRPSRRLARVRRLFVAVWPPDDVLDLVGRLERPAVAGLRWTTRDQWHVTLRFLGPVPDAGPVVDVLAGLPPTGTVRATVGPATGRFGQRILHVPVAGLDGLAAAVVAATAGLGKPPEDRPFHGHLTLARVAKDARVNLRALAGTPVRGEWDVETVCLVESRLSPAGARYEVLERFPPA